MFLIRLFDLKLKFSVFAICCISCNFFINVIVQAPLGSEYQPVEAAQARNGGDWAHKSVKSVANDVTKKITLHTAAASKACGKGRPATPLSCSFLASCSPSSPSSAVFFSPSHRWLQSPRSTSWLGMFFLRKTVPPQLTKNKKLKWASIFSHLLQCNAVLHGDFPIGRSGTGCRFLLNLLFSFDYEMQIAYFCYIWFSY